MWRRLGSVVCSLVLLGSCGRDEGGDTGGPIDHPRGADRLVVRMDVYGGLVPIDVRLGEMPDRSLYGDGRLIELGPVPEIYPPPALPSLLVTPLAEPGVQAVLRAARDAGLMAGSARLDVPDLFDATTTAFTVVAEGRRHQVDVYGLGYPGAEGATDEERAARAAFAAFARRLGELESWLPEGSVGATRTYPPEAIRVFVLPPSEGMDPGYEPDVRTWPLDAPLATFGEPVDVPGARCGALAGPAAETLLREARAATALTQWVSGGERFELVLRPLLPDETGC